MSELRHRIELVDEPLPAPTEGRLVIVEEDRDLVMSAANLVHDPQSKKAHPIVVMTDAHAAKSHRIGDVIVVDTWAWFVVVYDLERTPMVDEKTLTFSMRKLFERIVTSETASRTDSVHLVTPGLRGNTIGLSDAVDIVSTAVAEALVDDDAPWRRCCLHTRTAR